MNTIEVKNKMKKDSDFAKKIESFYNIKTHKEENIIISPITGRKINFSEILFFNLNKH